MSDILMDAEMHEESKLAQGWFWHARRDGECWEISIVDSNRRVEGPFRYERGQFRPKFIHGDEPQSSYTYLDFTLVKPNPPELSGVAEAVAREAIESIADRNQSQAKE